MVMMRSATISPLGRCLKLLPAAESHIAPGRPAELAVGIAPGRRARPWTVAGPEIPGLLRPPCGHSTAAHNASDGIDVTTVFWCRHRICTRGGRWESSAWQLYRKTRSDLPLLVIVGYCSVPNAWLLHGSRPPFRTDGLNDEKVAGG